MNVTQIAGVSADFFIAEGYFALDAADPHKFAHSMTCLDPSMDYASKCLELPTVLYIHDGKGITYLAYNNETRQCAMLCYEGKSCVNGGGKCMVRHQHENIFGHLKDATPVAGGCMTSNNVPQGQKYTYNNTAVQSSTVYNYCFEGNSPVAVKAETMTGDTLFVDRFLALVPGPTPTHAFRVPHECTCGTVG